MNILIAYPGEFIKTEFYYDKNIIFLDDSGWSVYDQHIKSRVLRTIGFSKGTSFSSITPKGIRDTINWWSPIWTRWVSGSFNYELYRIKSLQIIDNIYNDLKFFEIQSAVLCTAVSHHIDSSLLQISLAKAYIPQVFLYSNVIDGRLLPLIQTDSIFDRKILNFDISKVTYNSSLDFFIENKKAGNPPLVNTNVSNFKRNFLISILFVFYMYLRDSLFKYLYQNVKKSNWASFFNEINLFDSIKLMCTQRGFLNEYKLNKLDLASSDSFIKKNGVKLVIAAHYQPEATSFPEGGNFSNHVEILMKVRSLGHLDIIGYKEHPASWMYTDNIIGSTRVGIYRSKEYLKHLMKLGCIFIDERYPLPLAGSGASNYLPITISGSIAIERSLLGFYTIVAGEPWFKGLPGVIHLEDITSLDVIPDIWTMHSISIENDAREFLLSKLNNSTITNVIGVGSGILVNEFDQISTFKKEFIQLIEMLKRVRI